MTCGAHVSGRAAAGARSMPTMAVHSTVSSAPGRVTDLLQLEAEVAALARDHDVVRDMCSRGHRRFRARQRRCGLTAVVADGGQCAAVSRVVEASVVQSTWTL